jgi:hypothetical protein
MRERFLIAIKAILDALKHYLFTILLVPLVGCLLTRKWTELGSSLSGYSPAAVRAYVALAFLRQTLGTDAVEYQYATGGISPAAPNGKKDASTRKAGAWFFFSCVFYSAPSEQRWT